MLAPTELVGKTALVTGATSGIGLETAVALADAGAEVVITGRAGERIEAALQKLHTRAPNGRISALQADFSSLSNVRKLATAFRETHSRLDLLFNNAGSVNSRRQLTTDRIETTLAVNYLAPFLLTNLLLDLVTAAAPARIINTGSTIHYRGTLDFGNLNFEHGYGLMRAYARSKLALVLFSRELARRLEGSNASVFTVHPGMVGTNIWAHGAPRWVSAPFNVAMTPAKRWLMRSPTQGAQTLLYAATSHELDGKTDLYLENNRARPPARLGADDALARRLWDTSAALTRLDVEPATAS